MKVLVAIIFMLALMASTIAHANISIVDINHPANYKLTKNPSSLDQLADGYKAKHPIWTRKGSLGWVNRTPLRISFTVNSLSGNKSCKGAIRIHTGKSLRSGVNIPKRFDVYSKKKDGSYTYLSGSQIDTGNYSDGSSHWIEFSNVNLYMNMVLVVHARDRFIMLDEIDVVTGDCNDILSEDENVLNVNDPVIDSTSRLKTYYKSTSVQLKKNIEKGLIVGVFNNIDEYLSGVTSRYQTPNNIVGFYGESESRIIAISNGSNKRAELDLEDLHDDVKESFKVYKIEKVLAANGQAIYDPLIPISGNKLSIGANSVALLLIKFVLNEAAQQKRKISLIFNAAGINDFMKVDFSINVLYLHDIGYSPRVNVWAYRQEYLFKIDENKSMQIMRDCGVNVFVLHPSLLPGNMHNKEWTSKHRDQLIEDLVFYKDKGLMLLFVNWSEQVTNYAKTKSVDKKLITKWLRQITDVVKQVGVPYDQWALYPIDEPSGSELAYLYDLTTVVKGIDDKVRIYSNPISSKTDPTNFKQLKNVSDRIDYWQPDIKYIKNKGINHFSSLNQEWWVYSNPESPAKSSGDLFYRAMAWNAWAVGATGIGFWSFSDSGKSSAWDDFDGARPDYAVVYENKDTIVTSLRWESFCDGIEDFRLLNSVRDKSNIRSIISKNLDDLSRSRESIYKYRKYMYDLYPKDSPSNSLDIIQ